MAYCRCDHLAGEASGAPRGASADSVSLGTGHRAGAIVKLLEEKGHVHHVQEGPRYIFLPVVSPNRARESALKQLLSTFFENSPAEAMSALLDLSSTELSEEQLDDLARLIEEARKEGR